MHQEQRQQTHALLQQHQIDRALFAHPHSVKWLTGFAAPIQTGPNLFESSYPLVWYEGGQFTLIVVTAYTDLAASFGKEPDGHVITYAGNTLEAPIESGAHLLTAFEQLLKATSMINGKIGIEREYASDMLTSAVRASSTDVIAIDGWLEPLRMVKTAEELAVLRRNFALTDIGHAAARQAVAVGQREIDVWTAAHTAIEKAAGCRVPLGNDCVLSRRQFNIGGWPLDLALQPNESIIVDLSVILDGYWSDSCATYYAGARTPKQQELHHIVTDALEYGISLLRPGAVAKEIDQKIRKFIADTGHPVYPHHTGHGVGVSGHEAPRIVPYNEEVLQENMVIMLEPWIYYPGQLAVRLEDAMLITANGTERLTHHDKS